MPLNVDQQPPSSPLPPPKQRSGLRAVLPYTTALMVIVAIYVGWILWSRYESNREATRAAEEKAAAAERARNQEITDNGALTFTTFYASDAVIHRGQSTQMCYGVINATTVKLDPPVEDLKPTERHCFDIHPTKTTTYTITATNASGQSKQVSLTVHVK